VNDEHNNNEYKTYNLEKMLCRYTFACISMRVTCIPSYILTYNGQRVLSYKVLLSKETWMKRMNA
jgi:hypothetical protein